MPYVYKGVLKKLVALHFWNRKEHVSFPRRREPTWINDIWMPAFAGMTEASNRFDG